MIGIRHVTVIDERTSPDLGRCRAVGHGEGSGQARGNLFPLPINDPFLALA